MSTYERGCKDGKRRIFVVSIKNAYQGLFEKK